MRHELRKVRAFLKVAELSNFTRAALALHVSQSTLTVQIQQLEAELGVRLLDRNKRSVFVTQTGCELLPLLRRIVEEGDMVFGLAQDIVSARTGTVSIAALPTIAANLLPSAIGTFQGSHPKIRIIVHDVAADRVKELVLTRAVDFGLGTTQQNIPEIGAKALYRDHLAAFVCSGHSLATHDTTSLRELAEFPLILPSRDSSVRHMVESSMLREQLTFALGYEVNSLSTALGLARRGLGIAILPELAMEKGDKALVRIPILKPALTRQINFLYRRDRTLSPSATRMTACIQDEFRAVVQRLNARVPACAAYPLASKKTLSHKERTEAIPCNLNTNAEQDESDDAKNSLRSRLWDFRGNRRRVGVKEEDRRTHQRHSRQDP
jgi:LysR family carnitine catabolism transcriptional activator